MSVRVLVAGDDFVLNSLLIKALSTEVTADLDIRELSLPWPSVPFGRVAEVDEASGTEDQLIEALQGARICLTQMAPLTQRILQSAPELQLFGISRGGPVNANLDAATRHGVAVTYAPGRNAQATAEHTVGMILAALRRIPETHKDLVDGAWRGDYYEYDRVGPELAGSVVGLIGYGAIGSLVARMLRGLGAQVIVHDPYVKPELVDNLVGFDELLSRSQIISLHARATPETTGMIGAAQIAALPKDAVIVNCARGSLLNYDAVCDALDSGHLYGAAFDVFPEEPIPAGSRLLRTPHVVLTPHLAGASKQTAANAARIVATDAARYLSGLSPLHCANPEILVAD